MLHLNAITIACKYLCEDLNLYLYFYERDEFLSQELQELYVFALKTLSVVERV